MKIKNLYLLLIFTTTLMANNISDNVLSFQKQGLLKSKITQHKDKNDGATVTYHYRGGNFTLHIYDLGMKNITDKNLKNQLEQLSVEIKKANSIKQESKQYISKIRNYPWFYKFFVLQNSNGRFGLDELSLFNYHNNFIKVHSSCYLHPKKCQKHNSDFIQSLFIHLDSKKK